MAHKSVKVARENTNVENVLLYIDNSNIFEESRKHSAKLKGYIGGIIDVACRIDVGKLIAKAVGDRKLLTGKLYGSEPPALDTVWEAIRKKRIEVQTFERSKWTLQEKEIDTTLTADAVDDMNTLKEKAGKNRTIILFAGDRDHLCIVRKALIHEYRVEIWALKCAINQAVRREAEKSPSKIKINEVDEIFKDVTFTQAVWGKRKIPRERSLVASISLPKGTDRKHFFKDFVAKAGSVFMMPMNGKEIENYKYIVLVPCFSEIYSPPVSKSRRTEDERIKVRKYDFHKHIKPFIPVLKDHFKDVCSSIVTFDVFENNRSRVAVETSYECSTRFQLLDDEDNQHQIDEEEEDDADDWDEENEISGYFDAPHEDFIPVVPKHTRKGPEFSAFCPYKFWCGKGRKCLYKHTNEEWEFFKIEKNEYIRSRYKIKPCPFHIESRCRHEDKPYLCRLAHCVEESRCFSCKGEGNGKHWMHECPKNVHVL